MAAWVHGRMAQATAENVGWDTRLLCSPRSSSEEWRAPGPLCTARARTADALPLNRRTQAWHDLEELRRVCAEEAGARGSTRRAQPRLGYRHRTRRRLQRRRVGVWRHRRRPPTSASPRASPPAWLPRVGVNSGRRRAQLRGRRAMHEVGRGGIWSASSSPARSRSWRVADDADLGLAREGHPGGRDAVAGGGRPRRISRGPPR
mmetsp:Transcript_37217/g.105050  ORF Transcript_37217/g.105050 Transcript_37217/m.105050 type:complete len:204 (-) Transcript_37217:12-623(-)